MEFERKIYKKMLEHYLARIGDTTWRLGATFLVSVGFLYASLTSFSYNLEAHLLQGLFALRGEREIPQMVTIVTIDEESYAAANTHSDNAFPRALIGQALKRITDAGAKLVFIDLLFSQPLDEEGDRTLEEGLRYAPSIIGKTLESTERSLRDGRKQVSYTVIEPLERFKNAADGVISLQVVKSGARGVVQNIYHPESKNFITSGVPLLSPLRKFFEPELEEPDERALINYYGGPFRTPSVSMADVLNPEYSLKSEDFKDKLVFIGIVKQLDTGTDQKPDYFKIPASSRLMYGVEIHSTIASNLLDGSWLRSLDRTKSLTVEFVVIFLLSYLVLAYRPVVSFGVAFIGLLIVLGLSYRFFVLDYTFVPVLTGIIFIVFLSVVRVLWRVLKGPQFAEK